MATAARVLEPIIPPSEVPRRTPETPAAPARPVLPAWLEMQTVNATRHAAALRPFRKGEFGTDAAAPSDGHLEMVNRLIVRLRDGLLRQSSLLRQATLPAIEAPMADNLHRALFLKERAHQRVRSIEKIWDFYFELFGQRQSPYGFWLLGCDRIGLDCYQEVYLNLGIAKSVPAPGPFAYMRTGFSPATFRRGIPLTALGKQINPFPLVQLPYHRLVNPWTLGAMLHEVSHNLQNELGLHKVIPRNIASQLLRAGMPRAVARVWAQWNRETYADLSGLLLGGPAFVSSLMDVVGRSPETVVTFNPGGPHPTPYIRMFLNIELLRRMGFEDESRQFERAWTRMYPHPRIGTIPPVVLKTFRDAVPVVVNTVCYTKYDALGGKALAEVLRFAQKEQRMVEEAAARMARGTDPGIAPARFMIGATRVAMERKLARPGVIAANFYKELGRR